MQDNNTSEFFLDLQRFGGGGGGGGKSTGKILLTVLGFAVGAGFLGTGIGFGMAAGQWFMAGVYGASLASTAWSLFNPQKAPEMENFDNTSRFDQLQNTVSSEAVIPVIYGTRKWAGNQTWHNPSSDNKSLTKDVLIGEGEIDSINTVNANDIDITTLTGCSYTLYTGASSQSPPDNYTTVGSYKNCAWMRVTLTTSDQLSGGNPTLTYIVKGIKVPVWNGSAFVTEWSDNPAWCVRDFLLSRRYGLGRWITSDMLDEDSFIDAANYCDELVSYVDQNGVTQTEKRYTLNIILDQQRNAIEHLGDMFACFSGFLTMSNDAISLKIEKAESVAYSFTDEIIVKDSVSFTQYSLDDTPNQYKIGYFDPDQNWTQVKILSEDFPDQKFRGKVLPKEVTLMGVTRQSQALRLARLYRDLNKLCSIIMTFSVATHAMHLECGDVIQVTWNNVFTNAPFRILEMHQGNGVYQLRCRQYNSTIYNDELGAEIQIKDYTPTTTKQTPPADVANFTATQSGRFINLAWDRTNQANTYEVREGATWETGVRIGDLTTSLTYQLQNITLGIHTYWIKTYSAYGLASINAISSTLTVTQYVPQVSNITIDEDTFALKDGTYLSDLYISFSPPTYDYIDKYHIAYELDSSGTWINYGDTTTDSFVIKSLPNTKNIKIRITVIDRSGLNGTSFTGDSYTITGKSAPPSNITGLTITQDPSDSTKVIITCDKITDIDFKAIDVRVGGTTWDNAPVVLPLTYGFSLVYILPVSGVTYFRAKSLDWSNNYSSSATTATFNANIEPSAPTNFAAVQSLGDVYLTWEKSPESDIIGYEIREGASFDSGSLIVSRYAGLNYTVPVSTLTTYKYHIKAINRAGYYSVLDSTVIINITDLPTLNIILTYNEMVLQSGTHNNTKFTLSFYTCLTLPGYCDDTYYIGILCNSFAQGTVLSLVSPYTSGTYDIQTKDLGVIKPINITSNFSSSALLSTGNTAKLQFNTSKDNTNWEGWQDFVPCSKVARYVAFRVVISETDSTHPVEVYNCTESFDVGDVISSGTSTVGAGGTTITYGYVYNVNPIVVASPYGTNVREEITAIGLTSFTVKVYNATTNVDTGGTVNWFAKGY